MPLVTLPDKAELLIGASRMGAMLHGGRVVWQPSRETLTVSGGTITQFVRGGINYAQVVWRQGGGFTLSGDVDAQWALGAGAGTGARSTQAAWTPGGGGAGGLLYGTSLLAGEYAIEIGAGGPANDSVLGGYNGSDSTLSFAGGDITAIGGGRGATSGTGNDIPGAGGSGGGGRGSNNTTFPGGSGTPGQGHDGGEGTNAAGTDRVSAGGGGADGPGGDAQPGIPGLGGPGRLLDWMEPPTTVCRGGDGISSQTSEGTPDQDWGCGSTGAINATAGKAGDGFFVLVVRSDEVIVDMAE